MQPEKILGLAPLKSKKNPTTAAVVGFVSCFVCGIPLPILFYLGFTDFLAVFCIEFLFGFVSAFTAGIPLIFIPIAEAIWSYQRVKGSNEILDRLALQGSERQLTSPLQPYQPPQAAQQNQVPNGSGNFCSQCGAQIAPASVFCGGCGNRVG
jgi:hypothetical protein